MPSGYTTLGNRAAAFTASRAIDGNTDGDLWDLSASATNNESQPWWQVDLASSQSIGSIEVWPRTDCCTEHTANFYVFVSHSAFTSNDPNVIRNQSGVSSYFVTGYTSAATVITINRSGRYVRVARTDSQYLVLGEVKVLSPGGGSGGTRYFLSDVQGSTRAVMNNSGVGTSTIVARHDYLPFGEEIWSGTGLRTTVQGYGAPDKSRTRYGLTERDDTTGLDHTWFRKYEQYSGRWTSPDPYRGSMTTANPQSFKLRRAFR